MHGHCKQGPLGWCTLQDTGAILNTLVSAGIRGEGFILEQT